MYKGDTDKQLAQTDVQGNIIVYYKIELNTPLWKIYKITKNLDAQEQNGNKI